MEMLKELVGMVKDLPDMAIYVIAFVFAYKTLIVGSVFGIIKLLIIKAHDVLKNRTITHEYEFSGYVVSSAKPSIDRLLTLLASQNNYIDTAQVEKAISIIKEHRGKK